MGTYTRNRKILYVDDESALLSSFKSLMRKEDAETHVLQDSTQIECALKNDGPFSVVLSDQRMPTLDGVGVLEAVGRIHPPTIRIMVTGYADHADTLRAINVGGVAHYIAKPWKDDDLRLLIADCIARFNLTQENQFLLDELAARNIALGELLDGTVSETVRMLGDLVEFVNPDAAAHATRIRQLGKAVLDMTTDISPEEKWNAARAIDLCYLGIAILPPWIQISLNKQGLGALDRFPQAKNHHLLAAGLTKDIPRFDEVSRILRLQAKDFNGYGEPLDEQIRGEDIPFGARLLHILLEIDRQTTNHFKGRDILRRMLGQTTKFDTRIITRMLEGPESVSAQEVEVELDVMQLEAGMELLQDVVTETGQCLLRSGASLSGTSINILRQWHKKDPLVDRVKVRQRAGQ
jgi:response regulator RpfG family c-di-GMP phosphodiesterase